MINGEAQKKQKLKRTAGERQQKENEEEGKKRDKTEVKRKTMMKDEDKIKNGKRRTGELRR